MFHRIIDFVFDIIGFKELSVQSQRLRICVNHSLSKVVILLTVLGVPRVDSQTQLLRTCPIIAQQVLEYGDARSFPTASYPRREALFYADNTVAVRCEFVPFVELLLSST
ncbi:hypothetical protein KCU77_g102, partial [Aureobasidium melanogenum]